MVRLGVDGCLFEELVELVLGESEHLGSVAEAPWTLRSTARWYTIGFPCPSTRE
jgi:hypothetical protein